MDETFGLHPETLELYKKRYVEMIARHMGITDPPVRFRLSRCHNREEHSYLVEARIGSVQMHGGRGADGHEAWESAIKFLDDYVSSPFYEKW